MTSNLSPQETAILNTRISSAGMIYVNSMVTDQAVFYDARASLFDSQNEVPERIKRRQVIYGIYQSLLKKWISGKSLTYLDFGCGTGTSTNQFLDALKAHATIDRSVAIDISKEMVEIARINLPAFEVIQGGAAQIDHENTFDLIASLFHVLCHLSELDLELFFRNARRALKPNGLLCFDVIKQFEVGEHGYTEADQLSHKKYFVYHSLKPDGSKILNAQGQPLIGANRLFSNDELETFAQKAGLKVVDIQEVSVPDPNPKIGNRNDLVVVMGKPR